MPSTTNRSGRLARLTGRTTILVSALLAVTAGGATAAAAATTPEPTVTTATAMHVIGFDRTVAQANGYEIRTAGDGTEYAVATSAAGDVSPANVVSGNCGFSYVYEYGIGNRAIELYTGFSVVRGAVDYSWRVQLDDRGGTSYRNYGGILRNRTTWQDDRVIGGLTRGPARAHVIPASSFAVLNNGAVCYSGGPSDTTTIT
jgi:hypothetical protein